MYIPSLDDFREKAAQGNLIPVYREILADTETPVSAFLKINDGCCAFLLESVTGGEKWARYSFIGSAPEAVIVGEDGKVVLKENGTVTDLPFEKDPLEAIKRILERYRPVEVSGLPRFYGGAVGYLSYDVVRFFEKLPYNDKPGIGLPEIFLMLTDTLLIFDNVAGRIKVVSNAHVDEGEADEAYQRAVAKIDALIEKLRAPLPLPGASRPVDKVSGESRSNFTPEGFHDAVLRAKEYVRAGDIIQVVLSQRFEREVTCEPFDIYRALRAINPSPYMFYLKMGRTSLVGSSPEVMVRLEGGKIELRPIAGTRRRGETDEEDIALEKELLADPKERAEHIMLVDLGRNDVGRVSSPGGVEVNELMTVERYSHVMHIVSNVRGRIAKDKDAYDVMRSCFPAGTVSGAPKIRAMEIIEELEPTRRGPYAGSVGYFGFSGSMDTCITIRTIVVKDGKAGVQAGAGIVADSEPEKEFQETVNKAMGMMKAIDMAEAGLE